MSLYLLDTDHLSLYQRGSPSLKSKLDPATLNSVSTAIITAEELIRGRFAQIRAAATDDKLLQSYRLLHETLNLIRDIRLVAYDAKAHAFYQSLRQQKIRIGTQDLRIAAIALSVGGILVTRNAIDFGQIPGLLIEDWTK